MYSTGTGLRFGFHGCDNKVVQEVINQHTSLHESNNTYDWLGHGIYFWENSPSRALHFANELKARSSVAKHPIIEPAVLGGIIDLGFCLDLVDYENLQLLKSSYEIFKDAMVNAGNQLPKNKTDGKSSDLLLRELDCAVIETIHNIRRKKGLPPFDSVRGVFFEGEDLYPNAGFKEKNHIQICIINPNCIKGYFLPQELNKKHPKV